MNRVRITNRPDGMGLLVQGLEHAKVRRVVLVADPLVPPRVFLELLGHEVDIDLADVVVDDAGAAGLSAGAALVTESAEEFGARMPPAPPVCWTCGGPHEGPPPAPPTPCVQEDRYGRQRVRSTKSGQLITLEESAQEERDRRADWCRAHGGRS